MKLISVKFLYVEFSSWCFIVRVFLKNFTVISIRMKKKLNYYDVHPMPT